VMTSRDCETVSLAPPVRNKLWAWLVAHDRC
jgi:hypothetical protein